MQIHYRSDSFYDIVTVYSINKIYIQLQFYLIIN